MADILEQYKEALNSGGQEIVTMNKAHLKTILNSIAADIQEAYEDSTDDDVDRSLAKAAGKLDVLKVLLI